VDVTPNESAAHADLGDVYRAQDRLPPALREYLIAALLDPSSARAFASVGQMLAAAGQDGEAIPVLAKAVSLDALHREARYALGRALMRVGRGGEGEEHLRVFSELQAKAMDEERQRFRENQGRIEETLNSTAGEPIR
jgi:tetratricopeptide (TPR) repeat protein